MSYNTYSEREVLERIRAGDKTAFRLIYDAHYAMLLSTARRYIPDPEACRDLAQDVMVKLWMRRSDLNIQTNLGGYLRRMVVNAALDYVEAEKRRDMTPVDEKMAAMAAPEDDFHSQDEAGNLEAAIFRAIDQLPEKCRIVFSMSRFEKMAYKDIAERLGVSQKAVEKHISKALDVMRRVVQESKYGMVTLIWLLLKQFF
jgi:RNA polymerase sigma-70 factor (ECF subfamily)